MIRGLFWHVGWSNEITKLINTTDYNYILLLFFQVHTLFKFTFYPFNHSAFRRMADLMHFIRWIEPKLKRPSALRAVGNQGGQGAYFGRSVNPIEIRGSDYAHHISTCPPPPDFQTFLRPWLCKSLLSDSEWGCPPKINCTSSWIHLETWSAVLICQGFSSSGSHKRFREG